MGRAVYISLLLVLALITEAVSGFDSELEGFFESHCWDCHDDDVQEGGFNFFELSRELEDEAALAKWVRIYDRVTSGEMPPPKKPRPAADEIEDFRKNLGSIFSCSRPGREGYGAAPPQPSGVPQYRQ
ncbi:MAG: c-type cytochrome domain-containing protein [Verrucomicrobiota bacterium]